MKKLNLYTIFATALLAALLVTSCTTANVVS